MKKMLKKGSSIYKIYKKKGIYIYLIKTNLSPDTIDTTVTIKKKFKLKY